MREKIKKRSDGLKKDLPKIKKERRSVGLKRDPFVMEYRLLKYNYIYYCQGSEERAEEYALIKCPANASFNNIRSTLIKERHVEGVYEIEIESVKDFTIKW